MARRYAISPVIGSGGPPKSGTEYRASVADVSGVNDASMIPTDANGAPKYRFSLCLVCGPTFADVLAVTNLYLLPDYPLDAQMSGMEPATRTALVQSVQAYDLDGQGLHLDASHQDTDSFRTLINKLGRQFDSAFDVDHFGTPEVSG